MSADFPAEKPRKGLAIASLVLGVLSIPTLGLLGAGAIIGIVLGVIALSKISKNPASYGGEGMAIAGIVTSAASLALAAVIAVAVPKLLDNLRIGREIAAIETLRTIHTSQAHFLALKGKFGSLKELTEARLIDKNYSSSSAVSGYIYTATDVSDKSYCIHADRASDRTATRDFIVCEDGIIRSVKSKARSTVRRGEGTTLR
ncbi:MAG: DUF4190 domain-containing protein [Acidobacteria bacterium]|nr:DUF4190 domain-containing protein [Acidobacteriota bacterium]